MSRSPSLPFARSLARALLRALSPTPIVPRTPVGRTGGTRGQRSSCEGRAEILVPEVRRRRRSDEECCGGGHGSLLRPRVPRVLVRSSVRATVGVVRLGNYDQRFGV